jgi:deoxyribose-phosphate aldolase
MNAYDYVQKNEPSLEEIKSEMAIEKSPESLKLVFSLIDMTTLNTEDTAAKVRMICEKLNDFHAHFPGYPSVAAICVYPILVPVIKENLLAANVNIASVAAGFPSSQTFPEVKEMESRQAVEAGANEIDIVISVGKFLEDELDYVSVEIQQIKKVIGNAKLKVILETGLLSSPSAIYRASMVSMESGADFLKTSTGKIHPAATPEAILVMCHAIRAFKEKTGQKIGIKPAGGISTADLAVEYLTIVKAVLGDEWLEPGLFRIGASRLANNLLSEIILLETGKFQEIAYF